MIPDPKGKSQVRYPFTLIGAGTQSRAQSLQSLKRLHDYDYSGVLQQQLYRLRLPGSCLECRPWDSNPHALNGHQVLSLACLPFQQGGMSFGSRSSKGCFTIFIVRPRERAVPPTPWTGGCGLPSVLHPTVHREGLEPSRPEGHTVLNRARLPIPTPTHAIRRGTSAHGPCLSQVAISRSSPTYLLDALSGIRTHTGRSPPRPQRGTSTIPSPAQVIMLKSRIREAKFFRDGTSV